MKRAALLLALFFASAWPTTATSSDVEVRYESAELSVRASGAEVAGVLREIANAALIRFTIDPDLAAKRIDLSIDRLPIDRAIRKLVAAIPGARGHTMAYARFGGEAARLSSVSIHTEGKPPSGGPLVARPERDAKRRRMVRSGVAPKTAERVLRLAEEAEALQSGSSDEPASVEDLSDAGREQLEILLERGVPKDRAIRMLLLQERYRETLTELSEAAEEEEARIGSSEDDEPVEEDPGIDE